MHVVVRDDAGEAEVVGKPEVVTDVCNVVEELDVVEGLDAAVEIEVVGGPEVVEDVEEADDTTELGELDVPVTVVT